MASNSLKINGFYLLRLSLRSSTPPPAPPPKGGVSKTLRIRWKIKSEETPLPSGEGLGEGLTSEDEILNKCVFLLNSKLF